MKKKLVLIDGSSYFFRAFYAIRNLSTSKGLPTNAVYGFINMILKVLEKDKPEYLAICFDTKHPSFRKEIYTEYKSNRQAPPDDLIIQIPYIQKAVDAFNILRAEKAGFEADDVIATLTHRALKEGFDVEIVTSDKDFMQLVSEKVTLYDTMKDKRIDEKAVKERFGVLPSQMIDLQALMGDSSDNIPGVKGIGEKTASELIGQFGDLDCLYQKLDEIKQEKKKALLKESKELAYLSKQLVTIKTDVPVEIDFSKLQYKGYNSEKLFELCSELEFENLIKRLGLIQTNLPSIKNENYITVLNEDQLKTIVAHAKKVQQISVDTETTSLNPREAKLVGISLCAEEGRSYYVPILHKDLATQIPFSKILEHLNPLFSDPKIKKIGQNLKFDMQILKRAGFKFEGVYSDTLIASYLLDSEQPHNLNALSQRYLNYKMLSYDLVTNGRKITFDEVPIELATQYSAEDADIALKLHTLFSSELKKYCLEKLYYDVEIPLVSILSEMEDTGVFIDKKKLKSFGETLQEKIVDLQKKIYSIVGNEFNINSTKQLSEILFQKLKLPVIRKTKTGNSTDESVLKALEDKHEVIALILSHREAVKLNSTYVEGLIEQISSQTNRIHTQYNQTITATGRLSSSNPNLQNIPIIDEVRSVFIAEPPFLLLGADYSQVELRILAEMSGDKHLIEAFEQDEDIHKNTAQHVFQTKEVSPEQRRAAKTINFGIIYGQTPFGLSQQLKMTPTDAKTIIENYFKQYSSVKSFFKKTIEDAKQKNYVETFLGRRRYLKEIHSQNRMQREMAERMAINTPLQGTAADLIKVAMVKIYDELKERKLKSRMIMQVHDELLFEVEPSEKEVMQDLVREKMEKALPFKIPIKVDLHYGKSWAECK